MAALLLRYGADTEARNANNQTPRDVLEKTISAEELQQYDLLVLSSKQEVMKKKLTGHTKAILEGGARPRNKVGQVIE
jgi:hypothetical protein